MPLLGLASILGQPRAVQVLRAAVASGKVHHGYLFEGPEGVGKATCARALAMALNCEAGAPGGCGRCGACHKIDAGLHPDLIVFDMTPKGLTERVRELIGRCGFRPHEGRARVVVLDPAEELAPVPQRAEAANVLLKTLEEPPAGTHFVLVSAEPKRLPLTVRSRCQRIRFQPLEEATVERFLVEERGAEREAASAAAARAGGSLARALAEMESGDDSPLRRAREHAERLAQAAGSRDPRAIFDAAQEVGADREQAEAACEHLWLVLRDALLVREELAEGRVQPARAETAARLVGDRPAGALLTALGRAREAVESLRGNVAPQLVLEHLMLEIGPARVEASR